MFWRSTRIGKGSLIVLAVIGLLTIGVIEFSLHKVKQPWFEQKLAAARLTQDADNVIKYAVEGKHIVIDNISDPNETGLIGEQFTLITTDQGDLDAKLTTTNPNWAGMIVHFLKRAKVKRDDYVAVGWTGSMPAMNIAVLSAIETIGAKPVIITSIGASMWGANNPDFSWLDMEKLLYDKGIFHNRSAAASLGGRSDRGGNLSPKGRELCREIAKRNSVPLIEKQTLDESIEKRMRIYRKELPKGKKYKAYINVGGGVSSVGSAHSIGIVKPGLIKTFPKINYPLRGTMILFGLKGIPVIDITNIKKLATRYGLPISPQPIPEPPSSDVFYRDHYRTGLVALILFIYSILTFALIRFDLKKFFAKRK